jgi:hypothetical protein
MADRPRCWSATWRPSRRTTSSACWRSPPSPRWASCCSACSPAWSTANQLNTRNPRTARRCSTSLTYVLTTLATFGIILLLARAGLRVRRHRRPRRPEPAQPAVCRVSWRSACSRWPACRRWWASTPSSSVLQALMVHRSKPAVHRHWLIFAVLMSLVGGVLLPARGQGHVLRRAAGTATTRSPSPARRTPRMVLAINGALILVLGILPGGLMTLCSQSISSIVKIPRFMTQTAIGLAGRCCWPCCAANLPFCHATACWAVYAAESVAKTSAIRLGETGAAGTFVVGGLGLLPGAAVPARSAPQGWEFYADHRRAVPHLRLSGFHLALPASSTETLT